MSRLPSSVKKAICYIRKSREDEEAELRGEDTLSKQRELMIRDVLSRYEFSYDLAQEVASGDSIKDRPVFRELLPQLGIQYQAIVCKDLSRLGRGSYGDMGIVYDIIRDRRIYIITKDSVYDPRNFSDLRMIRFSLFFNREEYEMTVWRLTEGKYDGASKGRWVAGSVPYGYMYDPKAQVLVPSDDAAQIVRFVFQWYVQDGLGFRAIATKLRRFGYKSPRGKKVWHTEVIHRMLKNPAYKGMLVFRKTQRSKVDGRVIARPVEEHIAVEHAFDGIVDEEIWNQAQERLREGGSKPKVKLDYSPCELAGIVRCHTCGRKLVRQSSVQVYTKKDGTRSRYEKEFLYCHECRYSIKYRDCEAQLLHAVGQLTGLDEGLLRAKLRDAHAQGASTETPKLEDIVRKLEDRRGAILQRIDTARDFVLDGTFSRQDYEEVRKKCDDELSEIESGIRYAKDAVDLDSSLARPDVELRQPIRRVLDAYHALTDKSLKNALLTAIFKRVDLELVRKGRGKAMPTRFNLHVVFKYGVTETVAGKL